MACEGALDKADLVGQKDAERKAEEAAGNFQAMRKAVTPAGHQLGGGSDAEGDHRHSRNRSQSEDQQIGKRPARIGDCRQNEQSHGSGACKAVNDTHDQGAQVPVETEPSKKGVQPMERGLIRQMRVSFGQMTARMRMDILAVSVGVRMHELRAVMAMGKGFGNGPANAGDVPKAKRDQRRAHRQLHAETKPDGNYQMKENDRAADEENRQGVAHSPEKACRRRAGQRAFPADEGGDGDDVVGVGGVAQSEKKTDNNKREKRKHAGNLSLGGRWSSSGK